MDTKKLDKWADLLLDTGKRNIDGHIRNWQRQHFRDCDFSHAVIMDAKPLLPRPINFLGIVNFDFLNQLVEHPGRELMTGYMSG